MYGQFPGKGDLEKSFPICLPTYLKIATWISCSNQYQGFTFHPYGFVLLLKQKCKKVILFLRELKLENKFVMQF